MAEQLSGGVELLDEVADALPPGVVDLLVFLLRLRLLTVRVLAETRAHQWALRDRGTRSK